MNKRKRSISLLFVCAAIVLGLCGAIPSHASQGTITGYEKIHWGVYTGRYYVNGIHAFCAAYSLTSPSVGTEISAITECDNELIRKALYYGYQGPGNVLGTDDRAHVLTAIAISDANIGVEASGIRDIYHEFYYELLAHPDEYPNPPRYFHAYLAVPKGSGLQTLAFYEIEEIGYVRATKASSDEGVTNGNSYYSLEGAEYGVYTHEDCKDEQQVGCMVFLEDGETERLELPVGTYYAKEVKAPKGYQKSEEITSFQILAWEETTLQFYNDPIVKEVDLFLQKVDADTGQNTPQGSASLLDAWFEVNYYKGPFIEGGLPDCTWIFATDENGEIYMEEAYLVEGDTLYAGMPLGTWTIREVKASAGYRVNENIYVVDLSSEETFHPILVAEEKELSYDLVIHKKDDYGNLLEGAEFGLYKEPLCTDVFAVGKTDEEGILRFQNLETDTHYYLKEIKAPAGYEMTETDAEKVYDIYFEDTPSDRESHIDILNQAVIILPKTGSFATLGIPLLGVVLCTISLYFTFKKRRTTI